MNKYQMEVIGMTIEELKNEVIADVKDYVTDTAKIAFFRLGKGQGTSFCSRDGRGIY